MHEIRFVNEIISVLKKNLQKDKVLLKAKIYVRLSPFSHINAKTLEETFKNLLQKENLKEVSLKVFPIQHILKCKNCKNNTIIDKKVFSCPACSSQDIDIDIDKEFFIETLEIEYK